MRLLMLILALVVCAASAVAGPLEDGLHAEKMATTSTLGGCILSL